MYIYPRIRSMQIQVHQGPLTIDPHMQIYADICMIFVHTIYIHTLYMYIYTYLYPQTVPMQIQVHLGPLATDPQVIWL
jgi:hypothetical protein